MLKITRIPTSGPAVLKLEGRLLEPWIEELLGALAEAARDNGTPRLDLSHLTYVDLTAAKLLRELKRRGVEVVAWSSFVKELLKSEEP